MYHKTVLPNGLRVMIVDMPHMESVSLGIWIGTGGRYENMQNAGISHFLEHMVFKGTETRSNKVLKESIEGIGGSLNGFTGEEATCYFVKVPKKFTELGLDVLSDMAINPKLSAKEIDREREVIFEEIKMYKDRPDHYVHQLLCELMWPNHPLGMPLVGTEKILEKIDKTRLLEYKERFYRPENIVICVCGQIEEEVFIKYVKKHLSRLEKGMPHRYKKFQSRQKKRQHNFYKKDIEQMHLNIGFHNVSRFHTDKYTSSLLNIILGGNMSSRLFHEVREKKGLAYDISASVKHYSDTGAFIIGAGVDSKKLKKAIEVIMKELKKIKKTRVQSGEFQRAKDFYKGQLCMALDDTLNRMLWMGDKLIAKDINYNTDEIIDSINMVTPDMVMELAKKIFRPNNMNISLVGPISKKDQRGIINRLKV
ncbi:MAG: insulinase family protein [Candidatus Omnitrophica bacterium]|nr:insulinase family protein [Candidatus Omnitrophota bacterium]